jgi:hypothetical protein
VQADTYVVHVPPDITVIAARDQPGDPGGTRPPTTHLARPNIATMTRNNSPMPELQWSHLRHVVEVLTAATRPAGRLSTPPVNDLPGAALQPRR